MIWRVHWNRQNNFLPTEMPMYPPIYFSQVMKPIQKFMANHEKTVILNRKLGPVTKNKTLYADLFFNIGLLSIYLLHWLYHATQLHYILCFRLNFGFSHAIKEDEPCIPSDPWSMLKSYYLPTSCINFQFMFQL